MGALPRGAPDLTARFRTGIACSSGGLFATVGLRTVDNGIARFLALPRSAAGTSGLASPAPRLKRASSWRQIARTESPGAVEPDAGTGARRRGEDAPEVAEPMDERRGSPVSEQLIRKQPQVPTDSTQHDATPGNQTQQP